MLGWYWTWCKHTHTHTHTHMRLGLVAPDSFEVSAALGGVCPHAGSVIKRDVYHSAVCKWWVWGRVINTVDYKSSSTLHCLSLTLCLIHTHTHTLNVDCWSADGVPCVVSVWSMIALIASALIKGIFRVIFWHNVYGQHLWNALEFDRHGFWLIHMLV